MKRKKSYVIVANIMALLVVLIILSPLFLLFSNSFRSTAEILREPMGLPKTFYTGNFSYIFRKMDFGTNFRNSLMTTACTVVLCLCTTVPAGYAISRFSFVGKRQLVIWLLASQAFPGVLMAVGFTSLLKNLNLMNSLSGLVILYLSFTIPFCSWLLKGYFDQIPVSIEEAAMIDGCTRSRALLTIVIPMAVPGLIAVGTFAFMLAWNEFFFALVLLQDRSRYTLPLLLARFLGTGGAVEWGYLCAASLLCTLPPICIFLAFQKYLVSGLTKGAIK
ncbi:MULTISPECIES: carbohydrate ABC transporter permease [Pseudothermotoga]|jgi:multiple sugar transport system permease protein|uniref:Binding-protein-dependent transport systems inner membrane component n=1 Tax=Pseudothermotoga lettingae (strain ATCC BAA-301 / DSM 14385 / NBRC 107922 / TMO) TaxID=416591 RepID=A8F873_PSELT|nr:MULTISPECIES: carbohydrate ABC transporter permease [Pseudothermotoga]ABV34357.1 binding-protein-dependent transport systems inner membrane component [Pseudothermotoga lettingae TMO]MDI3495584.1 multiple sugar transport system permease protein [Pseudothermotoga sp.]MDK2885058.1 multiple sugar transport system permease protein [Pseudothermotoga sp.]